MSASLATVAYIGAAILFILSLGGLSNPETSRRGNLLGMVGMKYVEKQFFPDSNRPEILVDLWQAEGSSMAGTDDLVRRVEQRIMALPDAGSVTSFVGENFGLIDVLFVVLGLATACGLVNRAGRTSLV